MSAPDLTPQVTGRLADTELAIIALIKAGQGEDFRSTINLDPILALAAIRAAAREIRPFSTLCAVALQEFLQRYGEPPAALQEFIAKAAPAVAANPAILTRLEATLRKSVRTKKAAA